MSSLWVSKSANFLGWVISRSVLGGIAKIPPVKIFLGNTLPLSGEAAPHPLKARRQIFRVLI